LNAIREGYVAVSDPEVKCFYLDIEDSRREYDRKFRTVLRGCSVLAASLDLLNPLAYPFASFQLWSHRVARYLVPWFLMALVIANLFLLQIHSVYRITFGIQCAFYAIAALGMGVRQFRSFSTVKIIVFFVSSNIAVGHATLAFLLGKRVIAWQPSKR